MSKDKDSTIPPLTVLDGGKADEEPGQVVLPPGMPRTTAEALGLARELTADMMVVSAMMQDGTVKKLKAYQMPRTDPGFIPVLAYAPPGDVVGFVEELRVHIPGTGQVEHIDAKAQVQAHNCIQLKLEFKEGAFGEN